MMMMIDTFTMNNITLKMKRITFLLSILLVIAGLTSKNTNAQENDFGTWLGFNISKELSKKFDLEFEEEVRIFQHFSEINRFATTIGGSYSINKYLKAGAGYTWIYRHDVNDSFWENRHRYYLQLTGKVELGRVAFSIREKFQSTYIDKDVKGFDYSPENYLRSRLQIAWDVKNSSLEPYASAEMINQLNNPDGNEIDNMRYTLGLEFPLFKKLDLDTYLRLSQEMNVKNPVNLYLIGINLNLNL
jgi:hypothetical protein